MPEYTVEVDRAACEGIFACLVRDGRFVEAEDGTAAIAAADGSQRARATFVDDRLEEARRAAAACPVDAITVEEP